MHTGTDRIQGQLAFYKPPTSTDPPESGPNLLQPGLFQAPAVAPDGQHWACTTVSNAGIPRLIIGDASATTCLTLPLKGGTALTWCPIGNQIAFISPHTTARHFYGPLHLLDTTTGAVQLLTPSNEAVLAFFWSPDGHSIAYLTLAESELRERQAERPGAITNGNGRHNSNGAATHQNRAPCEGEPKMDVWVANVATGKSRRLTSFHPSEVL
ncbi:MAG: hypothetical protein HC893_13815 [Chloroflexaceae bacterium]|nr:hypothetical protein [Chloroflexaceae bacterium]